MNSLRWVQGVEATPLHVACEVGNESLVGLLLVHGADVNKPAPGVLHETPLHIACASGHEAVVKALMQCNGIDVDVQDEFNCTPLFLACRRGHVGIVLSLLQCGASVGKAAHGV